MINTIGSTPFDFNGQHHYYVNPIIYFVYISKSDNLHAVTAKVKTHFDEPLHETGDGDLNGLSICQTASFYFNDRELDFSSARRFPVVLQIEGMFERSAFKELVDEISSELGVANCRIVSFDEAPNDLQSLVESYCDDTVDITERELTVRRLGVGTALEIH